MVRLFFSVLMLVATVRLWAVDADAVCRLAELGFENVQVTTRIDGTVCTALEPVSYRGIYHGAAAALRELIGLYPESHRFELVLLDNLVPQVVLHASHAEGIWHIEGDYDCESVMTAFTGRASNRSVGKIDLTVYPTLSWVNHRLDRLCDYTVALAPALETSLWKGNRVTLQPVFPVMTNTWRQKPESYIHIGVADIAQQFASRDGRWLLSAAAGFFLYDRIGADFRACCHVSSALDLSAEVSYTGDALVRDGHYDIQTPDRLSFLAKADYYEQQTRLQGSLMAGRFVFGDYGVRADLSRHFGDYTIGLYGILTGGEHNAGFHFAIPFGPRRQLRQGRMRLKLPDYFDWEYSMVSYYEYEERQMGWPVETRPDENRSAYYWQARHVAQYTEKLLNAEVH